MTRYTPTRIILVNALGYPFETFEWHAPMMQLQGGNGAGKTTAMVLAVAPFMPDAGSVDEAFRAHNRAMKGMEGRVAINGNPTYSVVELRRGRETVHVGVKFGGTGGSYKLRPFMVTGLPTGLAPERWILERAGDETVVPSEDVLRSNVAENGGQFESFESIGPYFRRLYDVGILPTPLESPRDRDMYWAPFRIAFGGRADDIIHRLRDYVLPADTSLKETVARMNEMYGEMRDARFRVRDFTERNTVVEEFWRGSLDLMEAAAGQHAAAAHEAATRFLAHQAEKRRERRRYAGLSAEVERRRGEKDAAAASLKKAGDAEATAGQAAAAEVGMLKAAADNAKADAELFDAIEVVAAEVDERPRSLEALRKARNNIEKRRSAAERARAAGEKKIAELSREKRSLELGRHWDSEAIEDIAQEVGGVPLFKCDALQNLDIKEAAFAEAVFGPAVARGVVVSDAHRVAEVSGFVEDLIDGDVYLLSEKDLQFRDIGVQRGNVVVVRSGGGARVTPIPKTPILGAAARRQRISEIDDNLAKIAPKTEKRAATEKRLADARARADALNGLAGKKAMGMTDRPEAEKARRAAAIAESLMARIRKTPAVEVEAPELEGTTALAKLQAFRAAAVARENAARDVTVKEGALDKVEKNAEQAQNRRKTEKDQAEARLRLLREQRDRLKAFRGHDATDGDGYLPSDPREFRKRVEASVARVRNEGMSAEDVSRRAGEAAVMIHSIVGRSGRLSQVANELRLTLGGRKPNAASPEEMLGFWKEARRLVRAFLPQDRQAEDPEDVIFVLKRLAEQAEGEYARAEDLYRSKAGDIEHNIVRRIQREKRRVDALSKKFGDTAFGNFEEIRLVVRPDQEMLDALKDLMQETEQQSLLAPEIGFDDALDRAVQKVGRRREAKIGSWVSDLTDYRKYCRVEIEIRRKGADSFKALEGASTGERIGLTFFCLFMLLDSWEERDMSLNGRSEPTSARLLILDEAAQVDERGIAVLNSFTERTGSRIILAAPTEAPVPGKTCVYSLVRNDDAGRVGVTVVSRLRIVDGDAAE